MLEVISYLWQNPSTLLAALLLGSLVAMLALLVALVALRDRTNGGVSDRYLVVWFIFLWFTFVAVGTSLVVTVPVGSWGERALPTIVMALVTQLGSFGTLFLSARRTPANVTKKRA